VNLLLSILSYIPIKQARWTALS